MSEEEREEGDAFPSSSVEVGVTVMLVRVSVLLFVTEKRNVWERVEWREKLIRSNLVVPQVIENTGRDSSVTEESLSSVTNFVVCVSLWE